ncbi:MAG: prepilin peptidase [Janthinobacterium lividum]
MPAAFWIELAAFFLGLLLGSFLNVCISRVPRGESVIQPRSRCGSCQTPIAWHDNIPVLSWILLSAHCRQCKAPIPWRYPAVELATGIWFALSAAVLHHTLFGTGATLTTDQSIRLALDAIGVAALGFGLIGLAVIDWQTQILPDAFTIGGAAFGFLIACTQAIFLDSGEGDIHLAPRVRISSPGSSAAHGDVFLTGPEALVLGRLAAILGAAGVLLLIRATYKALRGREGMGLGDAKLMAMIAGFLGFGDAMLSFFVGMIACAAYAVILLARGRATAATKLPLGSFLAAGGLFTALLGEAALTWYKGLL